MPREFLPSLRGRRRESIPVGQVHPGASGPDAGAADEAKVILAAYYGALANAGINSHSGRWDITRAITEGYDRCMWTFKAVQARAGAHASLPFKIKDGGEDLPDHPLMHLLNVRANPLETGPVLRKRLAAQTMLSPTGAFVEVGFSRGDTPIRLDLLPPGRTRIIPGAGADPIDHFEVTGVDGTRRGIEVERVRWFRDPHPTDPYMGVTPLTAAGLSIELDFYARLYNVSFLRNDGRPGGIVGVHSKDGGKMDTADLDRIESRFGKGPAEAGKLSVLNGELSFVDPSAKPRDMQYGVLARSAKVEILSSFGVPESLLGYAADRTFANADTELYVFWTITMPETNDIIVKGFDEDSEDGLEGYLDTSKIEVLQRAEIARREEARTEVGAGLRSIWSYAKVAGLTDEIEETAFTRALWQPQGKTPIPARAADAVALGLASEGDTGGPTEATPTDPTIGAPAPVEAAPDQPELEGGPEAPAALTGPAAPATLPAAPPTPALTAAPAPSMGGVLSLSGKRLLVPSLPVPDRDRRPVLRVVRGSAPGPGAPEVKAARPVELVSDLDERARDRTEDALSAALAALASRWVERSSGRMRLPKERKGTRHWTPDPAMPVDLRVGVKALDSAAIVDEDQWGQEAEDTAAPIVHAAAQAAAVALLVALAAQFTPGLLGTAKDVAVVDFDLTDPRTWPKRLLDVMRNEERAVLAMIRRSARRQAAEVAATINDGDQDGLDLDEITAAVRAHAAGMAQWAEGLAVQATTAALEGARAAAAAELEQLAQDAADRAAEQGSGGDDGDGPEPETAQAAAARQIRREWVTRRDDRVRDTHRDDGEGQVQPVGGLFIIGAALLRYPGDPLAPWTETANCRCWLRYRSTVTGRYLARPAGERAGNPQGIEATG